MQPCGCRTCGALQSRHWTVVGSIRSFVFRAGLFFFILAPILPGRGSAPEQFPPAAGLWPISANPAEPSALPKRKG